MASAARPTPPATLRELVLALHDIEAFKFGEFKLKSGLMSPIYIDLRIIVSYPHILQAVARQMWGLVQNEEFDVICGVPYTALPIATVLSTECSYRPMLMRRKEAKKYGTKKIIEGAFQKGQKCLVVEDLVTSGMSVFETVGPLNDVGLEVSDVVVLVDRQQGGRANLQNGGLNLHAVITISSLLEILLEDGRIDAATVEAVQTFVRENQVGPKGVEQAPATEEKKQDATRMSYSARAALCQNKAGADILALMDRKKTNLCFSADIKDADRLLQLVDQLGPYVCCVKTHVDIVANFTEETAKALQALAEKHDFVIFEDRKFADIGNTVVEQYRGGVHNISSWSHFTNAHPIPGDGIIEGLKTVGLEAGRGLLLLAEMSSKGNLATGEYTAAAVEMAKNHRDFCFGFISMRSLCPEEPGFVYMTPGVKLEEGGDAMGQQYKTPASVIGTKGSDVIIVGRGLYGAEDPVASAVAYRDAAWAAYEARIA